MKWTGENRRRMHHGGGRRVLVCLWALALILVVGCAPDEAELAASEPLAPAGTGLQPCNGKKKDCNAPTVAITSPSPGAVWSGVSTVTGTAFDDVALARVEIKVDGGSYETASGLTSWSLGLDTRALSNGAHTLTAQATDTANNSAVASVAFTVSNVGPDAPPGISIVTPASGATLSGVTTVSGTATDDIEVAAVAVSTDGGPFVAALGTSSWSLSLDTKALSNGAHTLAARATDSAGQTAVLSRSFSVSNATGGALSLSLDTPADGATVSGLVAATGAVSGAARLEVRVDALAYLVVPVAPAFAYTFDSSMLANGAHTFAVRAFDSAGNSVVRQVSFTASNANVSPELSIQVPAQGSSVSGLIRVFGFAYDKNGVAQTEVSVDGGPYKLAGGYSRWSLDLDTATLTRGAHSLHARVKDDLGAISTADVSFQVVGSDLTRPTVAIASPSSGATLSGAVVLSGTASDETSLARVEVAVDGSTFFRPAAGAASWTYAVDTRGLSNGSHTFTVRAVDATGNVATSQVTASVSNGYAKETLLMPEGARIEVDSAAGWSADAIAKMLREHALHLDIIGPTLTVRVDDLPGANAQTSCSLGQGCSAIIHLGSGAGSRFASAPDPTLAHEYGHVWTLRHLQLSQGGDWASYLVFRGLDVDPRLDSVYPTWDRTELIADDYKELFAGEAARGFTRRTVRHPLAVSGLSSFFLDTWAQ